MPQSAADVVMPLSEMVSFKGPDTAILDWMYTFVKNLQDRAVEAVFQSDVFSSKDVVVTATEKNISLQNVYDQLFAASQVVAVFWSHVVWTVAGFTDSLDGLKAEKIYNRDFRFKALIDIVGELEGAQRANAGPLVIRPLMRQIIEIVNDGDRAAINQYDLLEQLNPFAGKSDAEVAAARVSPYIPERLKVRFENLTYIVDIIVRELGDKLAKGVAFEKLEAMADAEVAKIMAEVAQDKPALTNFVTN